MAKPYLENVSTNELQAEIERREQEIKKAAMPKPLSAPDFRPVTELCQNYIRDLEETGRVDEDYDHWMFETAMTAVFGEDVWEWTNSTK